MIFEYGLTALFAFQKGVFSQTLKQVICTSLPFAILPSTYVVQGDTRAHLIRELRPKSIVNSKIKAQNYILKDHIFYVYIAMEDVMRISHME